MVSSSVSPGLDEPRQRAEHGNVPERRTRQERRVFSFDQHDHRGGEPRVEGGAVSRAAHGPVGIGRLGWRAAAATEAMALHARPPTARRVRRCSTPPRQLPHGGGVTRRRTSPVEESSRSSAEMPQHVWPSASLPMTSGSPSEQLLAEGRPGNARRHRHEDVAVADDEPAGAGRLRGRLDARLEPTVHGRSPNSGRSVRVRLSSQKPGTVLRLMSPSHSFSA